MSEHTILLIDDSATIRRLVDHELSSAGYRVILAPNAEDGLAMAVENQPDLIILDHQLPGTTGYEVCCQLLEDSKTESIPVVASSTLRKKAYSEYVDCKNVVDMLPKPYKPEVLIATVENAIETAEMVVSSQSSGSAVPEVILEQGDADLSGTFSCFGFREIIDLLCIGNKKGMLEVQAESCRVFVYLADGKIQAVAGSGIDPDAVTKFMPDSVSELAPVIKFTVTGRRGSEVDGIVELLDNKVLDPRLLKQLLSLQAAVLLQHCHKNRLVSFRFESGRQAPALFQKLPLATSFLALMVQGADCWETSDLPSYSGVGFVRNTSRGQNLDRSGLNLKYQKLLSLITQVRSFEQICEELELSEDVAARALYAFELSGVVRRETVESKRVVHVVADDLELRSRISEVVHEQQSDLETKMVRDWLALGLLLRRQKPDFVLMRATSRNAAQINKLQKEKSSFLEGIQFVGIAAEDTGEETLAAFGTTLPVDFKPSQLEDILLDRNEVENDSPEEQPALTTTSA